MPFRFDKLTIKAQEAVARSLRDAFDEGRAHTASELKNRMASLFEDLVSGPVGAHRGAPTPAHSHDPSNHGQERP